MYAMLVLQRIVSTNAPSEFIEARKEGRAISPAFLQPSILTGNPACLYASPSNDTLATLPRESKRALSKMRNSSPHIAQVSGRCSQYILQLWYSYFSLYRYRRYSTLLIDAQHCPCEKNAMAFFNYC